MSRYATLNGVNRKLGEGWGTVNGVYRNLGVGFVTQNGVWKECFSSDMPLSALPVGALISTNVNGTAKSFIVVHHGLPASMYDSSCDGTWLLMKDIYENRKWHNYRVNDYEKSTTHSYLNSTFVGLFDSNVQSLIKQVKIPYRKGDGTGTTATSGANGLSAKIFLLSATEVSAKGEEFPLEGGELSYFYGCSDTSADIKRVAYLNGAAKSWWLRSPYCWIDYDEEYHYFSSRILDDGTPYRGYAEASWGIRPAMILPSEAIVNPKPNADGSYTLLV